MLNLSPCPCCGSPDLSLSRVQDKFEMKIRAQISCEECGFGVKDDRGDLNWLIEIWNRFARRDIHPGKDLYKTLPHFSGLSPAHIHCLGGNDFYNYRKDRH